MIQKTIKPERPGGFLDFLPSDYLAMEKMLETIETVFRSFGFDPIETPRVEFLKTLSGETSDTGKNIFHIRSSQDDEPLAMPFDHTVPFARLLAANPYDPKKRKGIRLPWKRMAVGPVFRADTPQSGRYRQFRQFDADIAGTSSMLADAEIIAIMNKTMTSLGVEKFRIKLNNRKILNGLAIISNIKARGEVPAEHIIREMMRILDKLDKIGVDNVLRELQAAPQNALDTAPALSESVTNKIREFSCLIGDNEEKLARCDEIFQGVGVAEEGAAELRQILKHIKDMGVPENRVTIDFSIARGLDYYTGPIMETVLPEAENFGSVFSGGRYNNLVKRFTGKDLPATGASIGVDRLFAVLKSLEAIDDSRQTVAEVMVLRLKEGYDEEYLRMAAELREIGFNTELCLLEDTTFKSQFNFAISRGVKYMLICGEDEFKSGVAQIKNLDTREQNMVDRTELTNYMKKQKRGPAESTQDSEK